MDVERPSLVDTLSGYDPEHEDRVQAALNHLDAAMARLNRAVEEVRKNSDPPPDPGAPGAAVPVAA